MTQGSVQAAACLHLFFKDGVNHLAIAAVQRELHRGSHTDLSTLLVVCDFGTTNSIAVDLRVVQKTLLLTASRYCCTGFC